jgi:N-acetylmuramoyl-L-alanine amidase
MHRRSSLGWLVALLLAAAASAPAGSQSPTARQLYAQALGLERELHAAAGRKPSLRSYQRAVHAFWRVYRKAPASPYATSALMHAAQLQQEMGERGGLQHYRAALNTYQLLVHEYPHSRYAPQALWQIAEIERSQFKDDALADKFIAFLLKHYPRSEFAQQARAQQRPPTALATTARPASSPELARVEAVEAAAGSGNPSVVVHLSGPVRFRTQRLARPARIYVDLWPARLAAAVPSRLQVNRAANVECRIAQNRPDVVRLVFNTPEAVHVQIRPQTGPTEFLLVLDLPSKNRALAAQSSAEPPTTMRSSIPPNDAVSPAPGDAQEVTPAVTAESPAGASTEKKETGVASPHPDRLASEPLAPPPPTHSGGRSLTRVLGLKVNRIVIDAGHGGFDTGTIGPRGTREKDICLDIALRLGQLIEQRLPAAEVIYTRTDDRFVPLEERTRLANEQHADLFLSIHANSSREHEASGIETYYLNFTTSPEALEVAARENASSRQSIHELETLLQKIAKNEKVEESREFALDVQRSLVRQVRRVRAVPDRGVKKAPFVVLIGAHMPAVLAEVSFLSNPVDERLLNRPQYRQRIAEGLYRGIASYLASLNSLTVNLPRSGLAGDR